MTIPWRCDAITEVGPGGHFFGVGHTLERYETAFYAPILSDWRNFEILARGRRADRRPAGQCDLEAAPGRLPAAAARSRQGRGPQGIRRAAPARRRRQQLTNFIARWRDPRQSGIMERNGAAMVVTATCSGPCRSPWIPAFAGMTKVGNRISCSYLRLFLGRVLGRESGGRLATPGAAFSGTATTFACASGPGEGAASSGRGRSRRGRETPPPDSPNRRGGRAIPSARHW